MKIYKLENFTRGWMVGDFEPSIIRTKDFEFMVRSYHEGDKEEKHLHKKADEISVVVSGKFRMNDAVLSPGDIVHLQPGDPADFECLEAGATAVVKTPSVLNDKYPTEEYNKNI
jgi:quercetin dioxygenase-like cupin family protein